ncbi:MULTISPECIES: OmpA family protein [Variovorax]|jgi:outer membrane protein OmpA-like peptidoglycan-associated protein|uniref:OmpA family protein n=1 Tax=Variovorax TaxID=34072 RepID=UPI000868E07B|nr:MULTISPECIES: OmpA family protein [Variovorax]MBN8753214.1 OmpA family protein [Variovorax sp.]ODU11515.1 MAG: flagellar motor protein MotB [Variovorax sp. SCN 67-85]ODV27298.1 MAG: flagellar motor protein MotB [Variovorax sp. SCN 67-20]OJZ11979.1 MAG: flagellar motor protein MotB [Variovorax sp. 67-131]UKI05413.1 OmpA family protein [Variovorax paradoxus]
MTQTAFMARFARIAGAALLCLPVASAFAAEPAKDHPLVGRYEGAVLDGYKAAAYDEVGLIKEPFQNWAGGKPDLLPVEGKVTLYLYRLPRERSLLEVQRNYESSLKAKGFEVLFSCGTANASCYKPRPGSVDTTTPYDFALAFDNPEWPRLGSRGDYARNYFAVSGRYLLAKKTGPSGTVYASIALAEHNADVGNHAFVRVVETKAMEDNKIVFVDATAMQKSLAETGRINLYGILFDLDKDIIRPESQPTLDEMTKLMRGNPPLKLSVVGHTDAQGDAKHNDDLSKRRALAVIAVLVKAGVDPRRFTTRGAGSAEPVAPNDSEAGRAKNRRVELVRL